jgi:hypothetical protein
MAQMKSYIMCLSKILNAHMVLITRVTAVKENFEKRPNVRKSKRSYLEIIYLKPGMKIFFSRFKSKNEKLGKCSLYSMLI